MTYLYPGLLLSSQNLNSCLQCTWCLRYFDGKWICIQPNGKYYVFLTNAPYLLNLLTNVWISLFSGNKINFKE